MNNPKKRAIIFDLDGTLWDASETIAPAWNEWCRAHGVDRVFTPADCRSYCGKTLPEIAAFVFPEAEPAWREAVVNGPWQSTAASSTPAKSPFWPPLRRIICLPL